MKKQNKKTENIFSEIPKKANVSIRLPDKIKKLCEEKASSEGLSLQNWLVKVLYANSLTAKILSAKYSRHTTNRKKIITLKNK